MAAEGAPRDRRGASGPAGGAGWCAEAAGRRRMALEIHKIKGSVIPHKLYVEMNKNLLVRFLIGLIKPRTMR